MADVTDLGLKQVSSTFAGNLKNHLDNWKKLTSDPSILQTVQGCKFRFVSSSEQLSIPHNTIFQAQEKETVNKMLREYEQRGIITKSTHCDGEFISPIFLRPKKDGSSRLILNLKNLNDRLEYVHFKMDNIHTATKLISQDCFMASVDLKDAYYSVPIHEDYQKYLKFQWEDQLYTFNCLPNGLCVAPRKFTKLLKPCFAELRTLGHTSVAYLDDSLLISDSWEECMKNIHDTTNLLESLGFCVNYEKSVLQPTQQITFLGFRINSAHMTISLTEDRKLSVKSEVQKLVQQNKASIEQVARVIGKLVACFPAVTHGPLFYRKLDIAKNSALRQSKGNYKATMSIGEEEKLELTWWLDNLDMASNPILPRKVDLHISTDASLKGWGACCEDVNTGGRWNVEESNEHINCLELMAAFLALQSFESRIKGKNVLLKLDNVTAVSYINAMGGSRSRSCNSLTQKIWQWCIPRKVCLKAVHIPGKCNVEADVQSRTFNDNIEWSLHKDEFAKLIRVFGQFSIDLFATRLNNKVDRYISWRPDPDATSVDAFVHSWGTEYFYAFPPFNQIGNCIQKIRIDRAEGVIIIPFWPTQSWFPAIAKLFVDFPRFLMKRKDLLQIPGTNQIHPLHQKLQLIACRVSGNPLKAEAFQRSLPNSFCKAGNIQHKNNTTPTSESGKHIVIGSKFLQIAQL